MKLRTVQSAPRSNLRMTAADLAAVVLLNLFFWLLQSSMTGISLTVPAILLILFLPVALYLFGLIRTFGRYQIFYSLMLAAVALLLGFKALRTSFAALFSTIGMKIAAEGGPLFTGIRAASETAQEASTLFPAAALLIFLSSAVFAAVLQSRRGSVAIVYTGLPVLTGLVLRLVPGHKLLFVAFLVTLTFFVLLCRLRAGEGKLSIRSQTTQITAVLLAFLLLFSILTLHYQTSEGSEQLRNSVSEKIQKFRYAPKEPTYALPGGNLANATASVNGDHEVFTVTMNDKATQHLRAFVGESLVKGTWSPLDPGTFSKKDRKSLETLSAQKFYPYLMLGQIYLMDADTTWTKTHESAMTIENTGEFRHILYMPYEAKADEDLIRENDLTMTGFYAAGLRGTRRYDLVTFAPKIEDYLKTDLADRLKSLNRADGYEAYQENELLYRSFVERHYLDPGFDYDETLTPELDLANLKGKDTYEVLHAIRDYFTVYFKYDENPGAPSGDPLVWFAEKDRKGYDPHFVSLAVLLFREAGIPARYVEGYIIDKTDLKSAGKNEDGDTVVTVTDRDAHAWAEVYEDGVGWVPVDVMPGVLAAAGNEESPEKEESAAVPEEAESPGEPEPSADESSEHPDEPSRVLPVLLKILCVLLGVLLLLAGLLFLANTLIRRRIDRADSEQSTYLGYRYLYAMLQLTGYRPDLRNPKAVADAVDPDLADYVDLVFQERYSRENLTDGERRAAADYVLNLTRNPRALALHRKAKPL